MIILETKRLMLRTWTIKNIKKLAAISSDPIVMQYFSSMQDESYAEQLVTHLMKDYKKNGFTLYAVELH